jgi:hypothetical protein
LQFVVDAALSGQADRIKGYTIGVEALGRWHYLMICFPQPLKRMLTG